MDDTTGNTPPKTYLKIPFNGQTLRVLPLTEGQITAIAFSRNAGTGKVLDRLARILAANMGADEWDKIIDALASGEVDAGVVMTLIDNVTTASERFYKNQPEPGASA